MFRWIINMSEMLGNQYFMARNYSTALVELEDALFKNPTSKAIRKKLIICYTQTGKVTEALNLFYGLISEDIDFIIKTDALKDDCPCPELTEQIEKKNYPNEPSVEFFLVLGMIWLYCDVEKSFEYFIKASDINSSYPNLSEVLDIIKSYKALMPASHN